MNQNGTAGEQPIPSPQPDPGQGWRIIAEYIKDLSFEFQEAQEFIARGGSAQVQFSQAMNLTVGIQQNDQRIRLVTMTLTVKGHAQERPIVLCELVSAMMIRLFVQDERLQNAISFVEAPRMVFASQRAIIQNLMLSSGFSGQIVQPIDFVRALEEGRHQSATKPGSDTVRSDENPPSNV
ncbi:MAG: protein-export chaperone SecB [Pseudomonadota bacterium]